MCVAFLHNAQHSQSQLGHFRKKNGPIMPEEEMAHQTITLDELRGCWWSWRGLVSLQYLKFCLLTEPDWWKCASSLIHKLCTMSSRIHCYWNALNRGTSRWPQNLPPFTAWVPLLFSKSPTPLPHPEHP